MNIDFTSEQLALIKKMALIGVKNGNSVNLEALDTTPEEYKVLHGIVNTINAATK